MSSLAFSVIGLPGAQGSRRYVGKGISIESSKKVAPWRQDVVAAAVEAKDSVSADCFTGPVHVHIAFSFTRPKSHYRTGRNAHLLRDDAPFWVTSRAAGDIDKLVRSSFDALTIAGVWTDDCLVVALHTSKAYSDRAGADILIRSIA